MRNVIVTGGSRGLGLAIVERLARDGYRVLAVARAEGEGLNAAREAAARAGAGEIVFRGCDLSDLEALRALARDVKAEFRSVWGLVNNAGRSLEGLLANARPAEIEGLFRLNAVSPILLTRHLVGAMMAAGEGRIVNIASIIASTGYSGLSVYGASKASLIGFTRSLARELGPLGITVNAVAPGFIETALTAGVPREDLERIARRSALGRLAAPADVAAAAAYLLSDDARNVTGTVITVDAGATA
jgi:3-oxoacyl-[acyl-carrier protein] reductase